MIIHTISVKNIYIDEEVNSFSKLIILTNQSLLKTKLQHKILNVTKCNNYITFRLPQ